MMTPSKVDSPAFEAFTNLGKIHLDEPTRHRASLVPGDMTGHPRKEMRGRIESREGIVFLELVCEV